MPEYSICKRLDGKYEERLDDGWLAEYAEDPDTGLWRVDIYHYDVPAWRAQGYISLEEAQEAARDYYDQQ